MLRASSQRTTVTIAGLQKTIAAAVQQSSLDCQPFIGVYIQHAPMQESGSNWCIKGVKYGRARRTSCDAALEDIVRNLQDRYMIEPIRLVSVQRQPVPSENTARVIPMAASPLAAALKRISQRS